MPPWRPLRAGISTSGEPRARPVRRRCAPSQPHEKTEWTDLFVSSDLARREAEFLLYQTEDGRTRVEVRFDGDTAWLSLGQMAELFQRDKSVISRHIKNVFDEGELDRSSVVAESATTAADGKTYRVEY